MYSLVKKSSNSMTNYDTNVTTVTSSQYAVMKGSLQVGDVTVSPNSVNINLWQVPVTESEISEFISSIEGGETPATTATSTF